MDNIVLIITILSMTIVGFSIYKLGKSFFEASSKNPVIVEKAFTMTIILAAMMELFGLIMVLISLYIVFVK